MRFPLPAALAALLWLCAGPALAASLVAAPVTLEIPAPGAAATLTLRNSGAAPLAAQIRVMRWRQIDGVERLEPAADVVASPPAMTLEPGADYAVRIIRLDRAPVVQEQAYRLIVDELPDPRTQRNGQVALVVRYSIPVFFNAPAAAPPRLAWSVEARGGRVSATARNEGGRRVRLSAMRLRAAGGRAVSFGDGLAGYVLAGSTMRFQAPARGGFAGGAARIVATTDQGPLDAPATVAK